MAIDDPSTRIRDLSDQILTLSTELNRLLRLNADTLHQVPADLDPPLPVPPVPPAPPVPPEPSSESFSVGSRVQILNRYRGLQGQQGTVTRVTRVFIYLRLDSGRSTSRQRSNLRILSNPQ